MIQPQNIATVKLQAAVFPLFEKDISFPAVTMETKLYQRFLLTHSEALTQNRGIQFKLVDMPSSAVSLHDTAFKFLSSSFMCVVMTTTTSVPLRDTSFCQDSHTQTHTQACKQIARCLTTHMHLFLVLSQPTVHTVSHSSSWALPFFSTLHHHNCLNSFSPLSYVRALREVLPWKLATTDGTETSRLAYTISGCMLMQRCTCTHTQTNIHMAHSLLCKSCCMLLWLYRRTYKEIHGGNHKCCA